MKARLKYQYNGNEIGQVKVGIFYFFILLAVFPVKGRF